MLDFLMRSHLFFGFLIFCAAPGAAAPLAAQEQQPIPAAAPTNGVEMMPPLSSESEAILKTIPRSLDPKPAAKAKQPIAVDHADPNSGLQLDPENPVSKETVVKVGKQSQPAMDSDTMLEKAYNALMAGQEEVASALYKQVLAKEPLNRLALFGLATTYHRSGDLEQARDLYGMLLNHYPNDRDAINNFLALIAEESPQEALRELKKLAEANPDYSPLFAQMGVIHKKLGDKDQALKAMTMAVRLAPENLTYRYNLAIILDETGHYKEAALLYKQLLNAAHQGVALPVSESVIQERLIFISSNH